MARKLFIAATRQNDGKTVFSIGLVLSLCRKFRKVGFIKPVGQKYLVVDGDLIDKDALLMKKLCPIETGLRDLNPIAVDDGFTRRYLDSPDPGELEKRIRQSYERVARESDVVIIEGTGHAGVGSVFDLSNARVAGILGAPVIIISIGGIGKPIDEVALNLALFRQHGIRVKGVIVNKVLPEKKGLVEKYLDLGLRNSGTKLLGVIPLDPVLLQPNLAQVCACVDGKVMAGKSKLFQKVGNIVVGAMTPRHALDHLKPRSLLVTSGDRDDLVLAAITSHSINEVIGVVLTGGIYPHRSILDLLRKFDIPTIISPLGTYETASTIRDLVVKITEEDEDKIARARKLVEENIDIESIIEDGGT